MAKKSYDQRLKERWKRREQKERYNRGDIDRFYDMRNMMSMVDVILPFLFRKGGLT